ncbi:uncharacterized protein B4U79_12174, partial [Dinothrombium tinctorium]
KKEDRIGGRMGIVPKGWEEYSAMGTRIENTNFVPFKVPLKQSICSHLTNASKAFTIDHLLSNEPNLGLIVDLTFTTRYYDSNRLRRHNIQYKKIYCTGHGDIPHRKDVNRFIHIPEEAIDAFEKARGHKIVRENYVDFLMKCTKADNSLNESLEKRQYDRQESSCLPNPSRNGFIPKNFVPNNNRVIFNYIPQPNIVLHPNPYYHYDAPPIAQNLLPNMINFQEINVMNPHTSEMYHITPHVDEIEDGINLNKVNKSGFSVDKA